MHNPIISDASCFIVLSNIGSLEILQKLYEKVFTTPEIANEFGKELPEWVEIKPVTDKSKQKILESQIDAGESSAIALAFEIPDSTLILDDFKARKVASRLGLKFTGTIGVIIKAKKSEIIPSIKPLLELIRHTDFRMSEELENLALTEAGEYS